MLTQNTLLREWVLGLLGLCACMLCCDKLVLRAKRAFEVLSLEKKVKLSVYEGMANLIKIAKILSRGN